MSIQALSSLPAFPLSPEDTAALIAVLRRASFNEKELGSSDTSPNYLEISPITLAAQAARSYPGHPTVLINLALTLAAEKNRLTDAVRTAQEAVAASLDIVQTGAWVLPDVRPLSDELEAFLDAGDPPLYVGFGSMAMRTAPDLARVAVEATRAHGRRVVLGRGWADLAPAGDPGDCIVVGDVNQQALFPRVAAVVHHGGAGTTTTAALAGAPQVVVPQIVDQPHWARRVAELGIGAAHQGPVPTSTSLANALGTALAPETRTRATALAARMRRDGATVAARRLLEGR
jgi:UDP:flavonoid glycosyltransferase YjiC (YdhE family)